MSTPLRGATVGALLLLAGCNSNVARLTNSPDAGTGSPTDAGHALVRDGGADAGQPIVDAGTDAGQPIPDAGTDAGQPIVDAGGLVDAGPPVVDAGPSMVDAGPPAVLVLLGAEVPTVVGQHAIALLQQATTLPVISADPTALPAPVPGSIVLSFGSTPATQTLIAPADLTPLGSEGFIVRSGTLAGCPLLVENGNAIDPDPLAQGNLGAVYGAYALLGQLGFAFLHPLAPTIPAPLQVPSSPVNQQESPRWRIRGWHIHTMHPLELTELLNGFGENGQDDAAGWTAMLPQWSAYLDWALANRQNRTEWVLLEGADWLAFSTSTTRQQRLAQLVQMAHSQGMAVGIDVPIVLQQQNGFRLLPDSSADAGANLAEIDQRIDWLMAAGFDYIGTESGTTEFTSPASSDMLAWMNEVAIHTQTTYGKPAYIKAHCSAGQVATGFADPNDGGPLNFNFLPYYADSRLGVMPHTVEVYALDDPAPTYGNTDFSGIRTFLQEEVGQREVIWYPEDAYWVTYDISVPLFLPVYAERRVHDLQLLASDEDHGLMGRGAEAGGHMDGQYVFTSGWEWGYWLNDVVSARAAWNPDLAGADGGASFADILTDVLAPFGAATAPLVSVLVDTAAAQKALMIDGSVNGISPATISQANGMAYLEGFDTWDDISHLGVEFGISGVVMTQPERLGLVDLRDGNPLSGGPDYPTVLQPLLAQMDTQFGQLSARMDAIAPMVPADVQPLFADLDDALQITALRATQIHGLYDYVEDDISGSSTAAAARLTAAQDARDGGAAITTRREAAYRVDPARIDGWRSNPTAYSYTYLWTVKSQYFWWRDEEKAVNAPASPCYMNIVNPVTVGFGEGVFADAASVASQLQFFGIGSVTDCLAPPATEPTYPLP